jgi:hypothetical protein
MRIFLAPKPFRSQCLPGVLGVLLLASLIATAQEKPPVKPPVKTAPAVKAPAAKPATPAPAAKGSTPTTTTGRGPTTGGATTASHPTTTSTTTHTTTTTSTTHTTTPTTAAGRGPAGGAAAGRGPAGGPTAGRGPGPAAGRMGAGPGGHPLAKGATVSHGAKGDVSRRADGRPADVHNASRNMDIHHGLNGNRRAVSERGDHSRVVAERGGRGYSQHPYMYHGHEYAHRTYYANGRAYDRFYARYPYHGLFLEMYTPAFYFAPAYYGWAYNPWAAPIAYSWGWGVGTPWFGFYGGYFTPYAVYPSASYWLTDYMIANSLQAAYQAQAANAAAAQAVAMSQQTKDLIAAEVQRQIALENSEAAAQAQNSAPDPNSGIQRMMSDNIQHVFVVGADLDVLDASGTECALGEGDALQLVTPPGPQETAATLIVLGSKGGVECKPRTTISVSVADLQDMQNHMRETIALGMTEMQTKQGQGGIPSLPASARTAPVKAAFAADAPGPDPNAAAEISAELKTADQAEQEVLQTSPTAGGPSATAEVKMGQTVDQVTGILGSPTAHYDVGPKQIYTFGNMKITFTNGVVTDIQ